MTTPYCPTCGSVKVKRGTLDEGRIGYCLEQHCLAVARWEDFSRHRSSIAEHIRAGGERKERAPDYDEVVS